MYLVRVLDAVDSGAGKRAYSVAFDRSQACSIESIGNKPERAPHSVVILAIVKRSSTGRDRMVSSDPVNSIAWFSTSSSLKRPQRATITSLPVVPFGKVPVKVTLATGGTCHHVLPVACVEY